MNTYELIEFWREEERQAHIHGWNFSHIEGRYDEEDALPWDYRKSILSYLDPSMRILDIDTGGGEFLLSLGHPNMNLSATEAYSPNIQLCKEKLIPLGIDFREADGSGSLPFSDESFDIVINRHGDFNPQEIFRVLKKDGIFITQQVGAENDRELVHLLLPDVSELPFPEQYLHIAVEKFISCGFAILESGECFSPIRFYDVGALVWFARIIEWEFPGFSVDSCIERLFEAHKRLNANGCIEGTTHRFFLVARK